MQAQPTETAESETQTGLSSAAQTPAPSAPAMADAPTMDAPVDAPLDAAPEAPPTRIGPPWLEAAREQAAARRGGARWAFADLKTARTALVTVDLTETAGRYGARLSPLVTKVNWIAETLRAFGGKVAWAIDGPEAATPLRLTLRGEEAARGGKAAGALWSEAKAKPGDIRVAKGAPSAFMPGDCYLYPMLRDAGIETVILAGWGADMGVESSARDAAALGYRVIVLEDGRAAETPEALYAAYAAITRGFGDVRRAEDVVSMIKAGAR